ncbi:MAG: glycoside hydrolase family 55 protein [Oscillospiraceae bacterium]|nr:glycoside hydrolase family 55 protein [Oscillospiraceae bacterium]
MKHAQRGAAAALSILLLFGGFPVTGSAALYAPLPQEPRIVTTLYPTDDVVVADIVLTEAPYAAVNDGLADCTQIMQQALDDCYAAGGGTVFLPAGKYLVRGPIKIPAFVTLRGDWQDPDTGNAYGTIILADVPSVDAPTPALFTVGGSSGAMGLTVYYSNQSLADPKPYPFTFYVEGTYYEDLMLQSIVNCTVINGYRGLGVCVGVGGHEMMTAENFKGTFLHIGAEAYSQSDVGTWKNVSISNKYWAEAGAGLAPADRAMLDSYTKSHATGLILGDLEWTEFANLSVSGCKTGVRIVKGSRINFAGSMYGVNIADCVTGLLVEDIDDRWGMAVASGSIAGSRAAIENNSGGYVKLTDVKLDGKIQGCGKVVQYKADLSGLNVDYKRAPINCAARLFVVRADNNRESDIGAALQEALDEAGRQGGGVVYLPAGRYLLNRPVTVPAGVELRGSGSVAAREQFLTSRGTLIYADWGEAASDEAANTGQALITLAGENAGLRGIRFVYPNNIFINGVKPYNYTVRGAARGVYAINTCYVASYNGVDFRGCDDHFIKKLVGVCYSNTMALGGKNGMVEGCLQNANIAFRNDFQIEGWPVGEGEFLFPTLINPITRQMSKIILAEGAKDQMVLNTFAYGAKHFLISEGSENLCLVNIGADNLLEDSSMLRVAGGSVTAVNMMRYNGCSYKNSGTDLTLHNRMTVDLKYEPTLDSGFWARFMNWLASILNPIASFLKRINPF